MPYEEPEFLPWDGRRVPITFVAGYLGAGKTTAINELLAVTDRPIAVLVNDVGEINIDASLIARRHGDTVELTDGCVCCSLIDGFGAAFDQLRARETPPDHVVVELSGVADPDRMTPWGNSAGFVLDGVVVIVAADQLLDTQQPASVAEAIESQIGKADLIVLTKTDLVEAVQRTNVDQRVTDLAPGTPVFVAGAGDPSTGRFLALGGRRPDGVAATATPSLFDAHTVSTVPFGPFETAADMETALDAVLGAATGTVMRAKGIVATADDGLHLVQVVGRRREITPLPMSEFAAPTPLTVISLG
jgi:G3E family GTPase